MQPHRIQYAATVANRSSVEFGDDWDNPPSEQGPWLQRTKMVLRWVGAAIGLGVVVLLVFLLWSTRRPFPAVSGEVTIQGLNADVEIVRDDAGIPHIYASTAHDLFVAQGYVHAQDRFWQMDTWRHIGAGRLSEMFGEDQVETDAFLRTMGWVELAAKQYSRTSELGRTALAGYTAGVNAYLGQRSPAELGFEYTVMEAVNRNYTPEPWTAIDSILWGKVMAWDLRGNMDNEIARSMLLDDFSPAEVALFYPPYPEDHPVIVGNDADRIVGPGLSPSPPETMQTIRQTLRNVGLLDGVTGGGGVGIGSNSWVVGPERTATGARSWRTIRTWAFGCPRFGIKSRCIVFREPKTVRST